MMSKLSGANLFTAPEAIISQFHVHVLKIQSYDIMTSFISGLPKTTQPIKTRLYTRKARYFK